MAPVGRKGLVTRKEENISLKRQTELVGVNRTSIYRKKKEKPISEEDRVIMNRIDEIHTNHPTWGYRTITKIIRRENNILVNRKKILRMMNDMGVRTIYPLPNLSKRYHAAYLAPYLLRNRVIASPNQVWGVDITYIRMRKGFIYLFVIIDWYSRYIVDYELSSTIDKSLVMNCLKRALSSKAPEIINSDQGGHFTNPDYQCLLLEHGVKISMDGKGQALDNVRTERFFRTLKYDLIYTNEFETPRELRAALRLYIDEYNTFRPHSAIGMGCPKEAYENSLSPLEAA